jgi:hypothetical protein
MDRIRYLYDLLNLLKKNTYHQGASLTEQDGVLSSVRRLSSPVWDPLGFEVINIEEWLLNKLQQTRFA